MNATDERLVDVVAELLKQRDFDPGNHERLKAALQAERERPKPFDLVQFLRDERRLCRRVEDRNRRSEIACAAVRNQLAKVEGAMPGAPTASYWQKILYVALGEACSAGVPPVELCRGLSVEFAAHQDATDV